MIGVRAKSLYRLLVPVIFACAMVDAGYVSINITLPEFPALEPDSYLCGTVALPDAPHKLTGVVPRAQQEVVHHILLYGCNTLKQVPPPGQVAVWKCREMGICADGSPTIIYGWGRNAPGLQLPDGVGFSVGPATGIRHIVMQVHYLEPRPAGDSSGVTLRLRPQATPLAAGLLAFASYFVIPPHQPSYLVENECCYRGHQPLTAFAVRVHTHMLGRSVYMTRPKLDGTDGIDVLAQRSPQLPQAFGPIEPTVFWPGDRLKVTCDFNSTSRTAPVSAGGTHKDEMCNMYIMLYGQMPFITMCGQGSLEAMVRDSTADLHTRGDFVPDPMPTWHPPGPASSGMAALLGSCTGVAMGLDGSVWSLHRGSRAWLSDTFDGRGRIKTEAPIPEAVVVQMEADTGRILRVWGASTFSMPHMITVDRHGNVWVADAGLHQVLKFTPAGQQLLAVGTRLEPGGGKGGLCKPTKVVVANSGAFYVADGYCNSRVVKYEADGRYAGVINVPGQGQVVHSVLLDECDGLVFVASRLDSKVHSFDSKGVLMQSWDVSSVGKPWSLLRGPAGSVLVLAWTKGQMAELVELDRALPGGILRSWRLPGMQDVMPHDAVLGAAAVELTGASDRLYALYVAAICSAGAPSCDPLRKFVLTRPGWEAPARAQLALASSSAASQAGPASGAGSGVQTSVTSAGIDPAETIRNQSGAQLARAGRTGGTPVIGTGTSLPPSNAVGGRQRKARVPPPPPPQAAPTLQSAIAAHMPPAMIQQGIRPANTSGDRGKQGGPGQEAPAAQHMARPRASRTQGDRPGAIGAQGDGANGHEFTKKGEAADPTGTKSSPEGHPTGRRSNAGDDGGGGGGTAVVGAERVPVDLTGQDVERWELVQVIQEQQSKQVSAGQVAGLLIIAVAMAGVHVFDAMIRNPDGHTLYQGPRGDHRSWHITELLRSLPHAVLCDKQQ